MPIRQIIPFFLPHCSHTVIFCVTLSSMAMGYAGSCLGKALEVSNTGEQNRNLSLLDFKIRDSPKGQEMRFTNVT